MRFLVLFVSLLAFSALATEVEYKPAFAADTPAKLESINADSLNPSTGMRSTVKKKYTNFVPYVPVEEDYAIELGSMFEDNNLYWLGANAGYHIGRCFLTDSQTCQQYAEVIGGAGGRDGLTIGLAMASLRWQYVNFPSPVSPSVRVMGGLVNLRDDSRDILTGVYGVGYGLTLAVHERFDLRAEIRVGGGHQLWSQAYISVGIKVEKWLDYFSKKVQSFGEGSAETTGNFIKGTGSVIKDSGSAIRKTLQAPVDMLREVEKGLTGRGDKTKKKKPNSGKESGSGE